MRRSVALALVGALLLAATGLRAAAPAAPQRILLNGEGWTFLPVQRPFYGYELDAPGRWKPPARSHAFIVDALSDPANDWTTPRAVRVPMAWSSATSDPGSRAVGGDFAFPWFWQYVHVGRYERTFDVPASFAGQHIQLDFESVNFRCWVYVNDQLVTTGENAEFTHENKHPFAVDITAHVAVPSTGNRLRVVVHDFTASFAGAFPNEDHPKTGITYPLGDRCDYYNKDRGWRNIDNGILGDVALRAVPPLHVADVFVRTSVRRGEIAADVTLRNADARPRTVRVQAAVAEWRSGARVLDFSAAPAVTLAAGEERTITLTQPWTQPRLWWPHDPFLHRLELTLREDDRTVAVHSERFGFREVELMASDDVDRRGFYLNGVRTRLFGESVEPTWKDGYTEGVGTSGLYLYNPEYWSALLDEAKRLNIAVLRPHRGMWLRSMFALADEKGVMLIAESTINNGNHQGGLGTPENQRRAIRDLVRTLRNHPSVVLWCLANESPWDDTWGEEAARHDPTRPFVATQTEPRHHPSPWLAAATGSYAMGLSGYEPRIYGRHDANWGPKPLYIYEDNACYDQPADADRVRAVQQGLTIFRGHRSSGYEIVSTFYTWQKLYGQPRAPAEQLLRIEWSEAELRAGGYRPAQARLPLLDPWTHRPGYRILRPLARGPHSPEEFWQRSFSPVAVFDRAHDERRDVAAMPYVAPLTPARTLTIHNDDLVDRTTQLEIGWTVRPLESDVVLSTGSLALDVPLGGVRARDIILDVQGHDAVRVTYRAMKSGRVRFEETIRLAKVADQPTETAPASAVVVSGDEVVLPATGSGVTARGYRRATLAGQLGDAVLLAEPAQATDFVEFTPTLARDGDYHLWLHVPPDLSGRLGVDVRHDTLNTTLEVPLDHPGWIAITRTPLRLRAGALQTAIRFTPHGDTPRSVVDAIKLVRVR